MRPKLIVLALGMLAGDVLGQDFNVDVGLPGSQPSSGYAAAGRAGVWNSVRADHISPFTPGPTAQDVFLVDLDGNPTGVGFHQFGGMDLVAANDPSVSGDDAALLNDYLATHSALEDCMYLNGLVDGDYEVITYAWMPNSPGTLQNVRFDNHPGNELAGGAWGGQHASSVTYTREIVTVTGGHLGWHVGIPSGGAAFPGAAFNGFQIRRLGPPAGAVPLPAWFPAAAALALGLAGVFVLRRQRVAASSAGV